MGLRTYTLRLIAGLAILILPVLYAINEGMDLRRPDPHDHEIQNLLSYAGLVLFSYVNHTRFVPQWYLTKRYARYALVVGLCLLAVAYVPQRIEQWTFLRPPAEPTPMGWLAQVLWKENLYPVRPTGPPPGTDGPLTGAPGLRPDGHRPLPPTFRRPPNERADRLIPPPLLVKWSIILLLGCVSALVSISVQTNSRLQRIETEKLNTELLQLKAQIQPHFLFNTLNSIYALALRKDDRTPETIVKLSEFMRYIIRDAHQDRVSLEKEEAYIQNYIDLQRARLRDAVPVHYTLEGNVLGKQIAPLVLFSFIENAFKHGVNPDADSLIRMTLTVADDTLRLHVFNNKVPVSSMEASNGVGLQNARDRLRLLYPNAHELLINDAPDHFLVDLKLRLV